MRVAITLLCLTGLLAVGCGDDDDQSAAGAAGSAGSAGSSTGATGGSAGSGTGATGGSGGSAGASATGGSQGGSANGGSSGSGGSTGGSAGSGGSTGGVGGSGGSGGNTFLKPPNAGEGIQLRMDSSLDAGVETERCQLFKLPEGADLLVNRQETQYTPGSHHFLLYTTSYSEIPTTKSDGTPIEPGAVVDCPDGAPADFDVDRVVGGSQTAEGANIFGQLDTGIAMRLKAGSIVLINTHYLNASPNTLDVSAAINLYTIPEAEFTTEAGVLFYYNPFISVPAHGTSKSRMRCLVETEINIVNLQSHMHRRGVGFTAKHISSSGVELETLYTNTEWENVPVSQYTPKKVIPAGDYLDYECEFNNPNDNTIVQGLKTTNEMCMLIGAYYPLNAQLETCDIVDEPFYGAATWYGAGSATCADTLMCMAGVGSVEEYFGCVTNSCEGAGPELSDFIRCQVSDGRGACSNDCPGANCQACLQTACNAEIVACYTKSCNLADHVIAESCS